MDSSKSVHLQSFPKLTNFNIDEELVDIMDKVRAICSCALSIRDKSNLRIRLPLNKITIIGNNIDDIKSFSNIILDEINVKSIEFNENIETFSEKKLILNFQKIGNKIGSNMPDILAAVKSNSWELFNDEFVNICGFKLEKDEFDIKLEPKHNNIFTVEGKNILVMLDIKVTQELEQEGVARDLVRLIQQFRKDANLDITNRINLYIKTNYQFLLKALEKYKKYIQEQTLAIKLDTMNINNSNYKFKFNGDIDKNLVYISFNVIE